MTRARTLADMISDGVIGTTELADDAITPVKLDETGSYAMAGLTVDTTTLHVDSANNRVGVGLSNPGRMLTLYENDQPVFQITNDTSGIANTRGLIQYIANGTTDAVFDNQGSGSGGMFRFMQAGTERLRMTTSAFVANEGGNDYDFRIESDNHTHALFVDASTDRVGIKSNSPASDLEVRNPSAPATFRLVQSGNGTFTATTTNGSTTLNAVDAGASLLFSTADTERMRILNTGNLRTLYDNSTAQSLEFRTSSTAGRGLIKSIDRGDSGSVNPMTQLQLMGTGTNNYIGQFKVVLNGSDSYASTNQQNCADFRGDTGLVLNQSGYANLDFRAESDGNAHALFVDAGNNRIGFFNAAPSAPLHLIAGTPSTFTDAFQIGDGTYTNIAMYSGAADGEIRIGAAGALRGRYAAQYAGTRSVHDFALGTNNNERLGIKGDGSSVVVNEAGANTDFRVESDNNTNMLVVDASSDIVNINSGINVNQTSLNVGGGVTISSAADDTNLANGISITSPFSNVAGGQIITCYGLQGTMRTATDIILEYRATSWKSYAWEVHVSNTFGYCIVRAGGYSNGSNPTGTTIDLINGANPLSAASQVNQNNQYVRLKLDSAGAGVHTHFRVIYSQNGADGVPKANRLFFTVNY